MIPNFKRIHNDTLYTLTTIENNKFFKGNNIDILVILVHTKLLMFNGTIVNQIKIHLLQFQFKKNCCNSTHCRLIEEK